MPVHSGAPTEVDGTQAGSPQPQILVQSIAEDDSNQILQQNSLGTPQVSHSTQANAGNSVSEAPPPACGADESILADFIGVSSLQNVNIFKLGLPPLNFLTQGIVFALFRVCEYSCGTGTVRSLRRHK